MRSAIHPYRQDALMDHDGYGGICPLAFDSRVSKCKVSRGQVRRHVRQIFDLADLASWQFGRFRLQGVALLEGSLTGMNEQIH